MLQVLSTIDSQEIDKFSQHSEEWWLPDGALKTLHDINPARLDFIGQYTILAESKVLDVGCGGGILAEAMAKQKAQVTGIDAETQAIKVAKEHALVNHIDLEYICTPIEQYEAEGFDVITCMEMLEHVHNPHLVLEHCKRLIKPGGWLFLSTINRTAKAYAGAILVAEYLLNLMPRQTHDYSKFIKPSELRSMAAACGWNLVGQSGLSYNPISRKASLCSDVTINYLLAFQYE